MQGVMYWYPGVLVWGAWLQDSIAELLEIAPTIAISVLDELLLTEPAAWPSLDCQHGTCFT